MGVTFGPELFLGKSLTVSISNIKSDNGVIYLTLYDDAEAFAQSSMTTYVTYEVIEAQKGQMTLSISGLRGGPLAAVVFHDENSNSNFDMSGGLPTEGWGYSNNVGKEALPSFEEAAFEMKADKSNMTITMNYIN